MTDNQHAQATAAGASTFLKKNQKAIVIAIIAIVVIIAAFFAYKYLYAAPRNEKASTILAKGQTYFENNDYQKTLEGDGKDFIGMVKLADQYSGTEAANLANLYAGLAYVQTNKPKEAIPYLEAYSTADDAMISPAAVAALGNCYASTGQVDKGIEKLKNAAKLADNNSLSPVFLLQAGQLLETQKKPEEANKLYQEIKNKYFRSAIAQDIDKYIERTAKQ